jgi:hypothetical protein
MTVGAENAEIIFATVLGVPVDVIYLNQRSPIDRMSLVPAALGASIVMLLKQVTSDKIFELDSFARPARVQPLLPISYVFLILETHLALVRAVSTPTGRCIPVSVETITAGTFHMLIVYQSRIV